VAICTLLYYAYEDPYIAHSGNYDYEAELYKPIKASELYKEHEIFLPHESQNINVDLKDVIGEIDVIVAEVSYPSTGQGIELGRSASAGIQIICFYREGTKPSDSLRFITDKVLPYTSGEDFVTELEGELEEKS